MLKIRRFEKKDLPQIKKLQPEGWSDITTHFTFFKNVDFCFPVVGETDNKIVGVANCLLNKNSGWISHIIVSEKFRGRGFGFQLTQHVMNILSDRKCKSQLLIATKMGEKVYEKLGFKKSSQYNFYKAKKLEYSINKNIHPLTKSDLAYVLQIDLKVSGEHREHMLKHYMSDGIVFGENNSGQITGYYLPTLGDGIILATNQESGIELLKFKHSYKECPTVLPEANIAGNQFLKKNGFELHNQAYRMFFGGEVNWIPQFVYCRIGGFYA